MSVRLAEALFVVLNLLTQVIRHNSHFFNDVSWNIVDT